MPKAERGTPKDIANRIKAKGLQKLKYYCQMCNKQCRDENGFKCHLTSDSHLRQMQVFSENSRSLLDKFSHDFERMYLETLRRRHGTKRMNANNVYQEVIQDRHHIHMNSTKWTCLSDFVQYLGKQSKCIVEETERGWYVTYISRDPILLAKQEAAKRKIESDKAQEERVRKQMEIQRIEAAKELDRIGGNIHVQASNLERTDKDTKLELSLSHSINKSKASKKRKLNEKSIFDVDDDDGDDDNGDDGSHGAENKVEHNSQKHKNAQKKISPHQSKYDDSRQTQTHSKIVKDSKRLLESTAKRPFKFQNKEKQKSKKKNQNKKKRKSNWLHTGIYVRIISKDLCGGKYFNRKAIVDKIVPDNKYAAEVEVLFARNTTSSDKKRKDMDDVENNVDGDIIEIDQDDLETVIPKVKGKKCRILNGEGRGSLATLLELNDKKSRADLKLVEDGRIIEKVDYDDFSKAE